MWAVDVNERGNRVLSVLDLRQSWSATTSMVSTAVVTLCRVRTYACVCVRYCAKLTIFTCTDLLRALLGTAGSDVGVRHCDKEAAERAEACKKER